MSGFDLVIFDCDGVLVDSEVISAKMLIAELAKHDIHVDMTYIARHFLGRSYPVVLQQIRHEFGVVLPDGFEADYRARLIAAFQKELKPVPHVHRAISAMGLPYHLATSSSPPRLAQSLVITGLAELFANRTSTASEVKHGKPAPDLFLHVARKCGVNPERCLVIEDSFAGIRAGLAAGMEVWRFTGGSHLTGLSIPDDPAAVAHRTFASFDDFYHLDPRLQPNGHRAI
ncbi:hydrolase [Thioclava sp. SK-1]|uniref:HAD family hydrolase n=1 Tax=Thioclava sp. SK-1 TaxID=1889770 RepID=UPI00082431D8|nr:HAD family hydrolase [Thioclava sp. SK-1]OCX66600.1 hydrolase [Thioclava sp. SK-1]